MNLLDLPLPSHAHMQGSDDALKPRHIAILTPGFPADEKDTACMPALEEYLKGIQKYAPRFQVSVLTLRYPHVNGTYCWNGVDVFAANGQQIHFPAILPSWLRLMREFRRLKNRRAVDVVHSFFLGECALLGAALSRWYRIPHVVTLMGRDLQRKAPYKHLLGLQRDTFVAVSGFQRRDVLRYGRDVQHVIPWGIESPRSYNGSSREIDILGVGSLTPVKDFVSFLKVVALVNKNRPDLRCRIVGEGPQRRELEQLIVALQLSDAVGFEGKVTRERVLELMSQSRVFLHTSTFESFGVVFTEALACGASIVSRSVGVAYPSPNWAVEDDLMAMAVAVEKFIREPAPTPSLPYPVKETVRAYASLYDDICQNWRR